MKEHTDFSSFLLKILNHARELLGAEGASIFLMEGDSLVLRATTGSDASSSVSRKLVYKPGEGVSGYVVKMERPILIPDVHAFTKEYGIYDQAEHEISRLKSLIGVPIISGDKVLGVIRCTNKIPSKDNQLSDSFTEQDANLLFVFAKTAAAAIEAREELYLATNAPYVFVLIPFHPNFRDVYELGIKGVAETLGFRCEKVDEIEFNDSILAQIYKGIQSADIVVADMTGRNPNVFYEVGYAHALHKDVVLLTQDAEDIPFDLKVHNHIVYGGQVTLLRERLERRLRVWLEERKSN
jgi:nucleoside 2-deoxyribosyltransferase/putative methionine-R-sulfoxide reductase with GAF domain